MRTFKIFVVSLLALVIVTDCFAQQPTEPNQFRDDLIQFIKSNDEGLKILALQMIIVNPDQVRSSGIAYDIYAIFRTHPNDGVRQLALNAIYRMNYVWLLQKLTDDYYSETNPLIRRQIAAILKKYPVLVAMR